MSFYGIPGGRDKEARPDEPMVHDAAGIPTELRLSFDTAPSVETRRTLGDAINAFHARTVPQDANPFALLLRDDGDRVVAGLSGVLSWQWLFVAALWVGDTWQGGGGLPLGLVGHVPGARFLLGARLSAVRGPD